MPSGANAQEAGDDLQLAGAAMSGMLPALRSSQYGGVRRRNNGEGSALHNAGRARGPGPGPGLFNHLLRRPRGRRGNFDKITGEPRAKLLLPSQPQRRYRSLVGQIPQTRLVQSYSSMGGRQPFLLSDKNHHGVCVCACVRACAPRCGCVPVCLSACTRQTCARARARAWSARTRRIHCRGLWPH